MAGQRLRRITAAQATIADRPSDDGAVLLRHLCPVVLLAGPRAHLREAVPLAVVEDALAQEGAVVVRAETLSMPNGSSDATLSNASTITIYLRIRMATHSVQPLAISVTVRVWTKSLSVFTPPQCSTMSNWKKPSGGSRQSAKVRAGMLRPSPR